MRKIVPFIIALVFWVEPALTQTSPSIVGAWERTRREPPALPAFIMFSADGYFSMTILPAGRPEGSIRELTREELLVRYERLVARRGPYSIDGNRLTRHDEAHHNPNLVGRTNLNLFRIEGGMLIFSSEDGIDTEWYRRMEPYAP